MIVARISRFYLVLFILLVILTVFYSALFAGILSVDDDQLFTYLYNVENWSFREVFIRGGGYYYRPLLHLTWLADKSLWGPHESFMHLENVLAHGANSVLVFFITFELVGRYRLQAAPVALAAALLFGLHPLTTESVNWISGRTDVLAGFFLLAALLLLVKGMARGSFALLCGAALSFFIATLAKETALFWFPGGLFFVFCAFRHEHFLPSGVANHALRRALPYGAISAVPVAYFTLRHLALRHGDGGVSLAVHGMVAGNYDFFNKARITLKVFGFYLKKLLFPLPLNFATVSVPNWYVPVGVAGVILCCYLLYRRSILGALVLMAAGIISPALLVPLGRMAWTPVAERYLYMPVAFVAIALTIFCASRLRSEGAFLKTATLLVVALIAANGYVTYKRNLVWQSNLTLFEDCIAKSPDFAPAKNEYARALWASGKYEEAKRIFLANASSGSDKFSIVSDINRAIFMAADKDVRGGIAHLEKLHYTSDRPLYHEYLKTLLNLYGQLHATEKNPAKRRALKLKHIELTKELQTFSGDPYVLYHIGKLYLGVKDTANAATYFQMAADKAPADAFYKGPAQKLANRLRKQ